MNKPNPELTDEENPELDGAWFARARPAALVLPEIFPAEVAAVLLKPSVRTAEDYSPKVYLNLRVDADIAEKFIATGNGWQTRINDALREWLGEHHLAGT